MTRISQVGLKDKAASLCYYTLAQQICSANKNYSFVHLSRLHVDYICLVLLKLILPLTNRVLYIIRNPSGVGKKANI